MLDAAYNEAFWRLEHDERGVRVAWNLLTRVRCRVLLGPAAAAWSWRRTARGPSM